MKKKPKFRPRDLALRPPETRGRPELPPDCRRLTLSTRIPARTRNILLKRAASRGLSPSGAPASSLGLEIERAVDLSPD